MARLAGEITGRSRTSPRDVEIIRLAPPRGAFGRPRERDGPYPHRAEGAQLHPLPLPAGRKHACGGVKRAHHGLVSATSSVLSTRDHSESPTTGAETPSPRNVQVWN